MRAVAMHALDGGGHALAESLAVGKPGEGVVLLKIAELCLGLAALPASHPGEGGGYGDAGAEQGKRDADDQAEIVGKRSRLIALVEIDDERAARLAAQVQRKRE